MRTLAGFFFGRLGNFRGKEELMLFNKPPLAVPDQIRLLKERDMVFVDEARDACFAAHQLLPIARLLVAF
jgi:hypothetical protein